VRVWRIEKEKERRGEEEVCCFCVYFGLVKVCEHVYVRDGRIDLYSASGPGRLGLPGPAADAVGSGLATGIGVVMPG